MTARVAYTLRTAAEATGLSERTIADAIRRGDLIAYTPTSKISILHDDLFAWLTARRAS